MSSGTTRFHVIRSLLGVSATAIALTACGSSGGSTAPKTGSLTIVVDAPSGVTGKVTVNGPNGYTTSVTSSTVLTGLAVGSYTVVATPVLTSDPIVPTVDSGTVSGSPSSVTAGSQDTATVTYAARLGSGGLWVANFGSALTALQYTAAQLASTTSSPAAVALNTGAGALAGAAIDGSGKLWVSTFTDSIFAYNTSELGASGSPTPAVVLVEAGGAGPSGLAFDANGNLWVANIGANTVVEFSASQLASSGSPTPVLTITSSSNSLSAPIGLAFDASGTLWVSSANDSIVVGYKASQLTTGGAMTPAVVLTCASKYVDGPLMMAFDASGNLWIADGNFPPYSVVAFTPSQLAASGSPTPTVILTPNSGSLNEPGGIAFDASGDLWVSNLGSSNSVVEFTPSQLAASGSPTPNVTVTGSSLNRPFGLAFDPHASALPIMAARRK